MQIFGVVNVSPDSLAEFTVANTPERAVEIAQRHFDDGADFIDMGAQASHGDAAMVTPDEEWAILQGPLEAVLAQVAAGEQHTQGGASADDHVQEQRPVRGQQLLGSARNQHTPSATRRHGRR